MDKIWLDNCMKLKVPDSVADKWLECLKNKQQPSGHNRIYHNCKQVVEGKKEFLTNTISAIILAVVFQYFEHDVKKNCVELNCLEFRKFVSEAKIEDKNKRKQNKRNMLLSKPSQSVKVDSNTNPQEGTSSMNQKIEKSLSSSLPSLKENSDEAISKMLDEEEIIVLDDDDDDDDDDEEKETKNEPQDEFVEDKTPDSKISRKTPLYKDSDTLKAESDDSIIFVSEDRPADTLKRRLSEPSTSLDYIALPSVSHQELTNLIRPKWPAQKPQKQAKYTEVKEMPKTDSKYNTNLYNPDKDSLLKPGKRIIIVDGNNVAFRPGFYNRFSSESIKICVEYFQKMDHEIKVVVPQIHLLTASNVEIMDNLRRSGIVVTTPCKSLLKMSNDDRIILQLASELDGVVISNNKYRDLMNECPEFKFIIKNRVIGYFWCSNKFILSKDQYGPNLDDILVRK